jgi:protocatechuate 3,4-dioxygenase beta subunit
MVIKKQSRRNFCELTASTVATVLAARCGTGDPAGATTDSGDSEESEESDTGSSNPTKSGQSDDSEEESESTGKSGDGEESSDDEGSKSSSGDDEESGESTSESGTGDDESTSESSGDDTGESSSEDTDSTETTGSDDVDDPRCEDVIPQDEGPYPQDCPERSNLHIYGHDAIPFRFYGQVLDSNCDPIPDAQVLIWHSCPSASGGKAKPAQQSPQDPNYESAVYDHSAMAGQRGPNGESITTGDQMYYGWVKTDGEGRYAFDTIRPGYYWDTFGSNIYRCTHIHVKIFVGGRLLSITQVYFPDDPFNARDPLFSQCDNQGDCMLNLNADGSAGSFNFKVDA